MELEDSTFAGDQQPDPCRLQWKVGLEPPPFLSTNIAAVELLKAIVDGAVGEVPKLDVTRAVAVQIYRLLHVKDERSALMASQWRSPARSLYIMLASLAHGVRTEPPDAGAAERLRRLGAAVTVPRPVTSPQLYVL